MRSLSSFRRQQPLGVKRLWLIFTLSFLLLSALSFLFFDHLFSESPVDAQRTAVTIPALVGQSIDVATTALPTTCYDVTIVYLNDSEQPAGLVLRQTPCEGTCRKIAIGNERIAVKLVVSLGPRYETVPDLVGQDGRQAQIDLERQGLSVNIIRRTVNSSMTKAGQVTRQDPPVGCRLTAGSTVTLYVTYPKADSSVQCPSLIGLDRMTALATLRSAGLTVGTITVTQSADSLDAPQDPLAAFWAGDTVISQGRPVGCWLPQGASVDLILQKKPLFYTDMIEPQWQKGIIRPWNKTPTPPNFTEGSSNA